MVKSLLKRFFSGLSDLVYPPDLYCICCGDFIARGSRYSLCGACEQKLHWITGGCCPKCGRPEKNYRICTNCSEQEPAFVRGFSCVAYGVLEKEMLHRFKYKGQAYLARYLGCLMAERFLQEETAVDYIVEVPVHKARLAARGYNQAALLAEVVSEHIAVPRLKGALHRVQNTQPMTEVEWWEREENIKNAFTVWDESATIIRRKTLLLVDDIYTTGSTTSHCSRKLLEAGAEAVYVLTFASGADRSTIEIA